MKKRILNILSLILIFAVTLSFFGCKKETAPSSSSASSSSSQSSSEENSSSSSADSSSSSTSSSQEETDILSFNIGNDMGQNIKSLEIKLSDDSKWTEIPLEEVWASGYMIPVTLSAEDIPDDSKWEIKIIFEADGSEKVFTNAEITEGANLILTEEGIVY